MNRKIQLCAGAVGVALMLAVAIYMWVFGARPLDLQPLPKEADISRKVIPLPKPVYVVSRPDPTASEMAAADLLMADLGQRLACDPRRATGTNIPGEAQGTFIVLGPGDGDLPAEGYMLKGRRQGNRVTFDLQSNDHGLFYGALTLLQILEQTSRNNHLVISSPVRVRIRDFPTMRTRIGTRGFDGFTGSAALRRVFEGRARMRMNAVWHDPVATNFNTAVREAERYGIKVYGILGYAGLCKDLKRPLCPSNPEDVALVESRFERAASAGAKGLAFLFDDIQWIDGVIQHVKVCQACSMNFKTIGGVQRALTKLMVEVGRRYGLKDFIICPTPYYRQWQKDISTLGADVFKDYFHELVADPALSEVRVFHCDFMPEQMKQLTDAGLQNYIYWINGLWDTEQWFSSYMGMTRLPWVWYGFRIDEVKGVIEPIPEAMKALCNLSDLTPDVFFGTGSTEGLLLGGIWAWNPRAYDDDKARQFVSDQLFGVGAWRALSRYELNIMKFIVAFRTYDNKWTSECLIDATQRQAKKLTAMERRQRAERLRKNLEEAKEAAGEVKALIKLSDRHPLLRPRSPDSYAMAAMDRALEYFSRRVEREMTVFRPSVRTETADEHVAGWWKFDDPANIGADSSVNRANLETHGQPESVAGVSGQGLRLRGGQMSKTNLVAGAREFLSVSNPATFDMGTNSFSVECWVSIAEPGWYQFVGNRPSTREIYPLKGWALGMDAGKDIRFRNKIRFTVDDGKKTSSISAQVECPPADWDEDGWNYLVAVRDAGQSVIRLYVNAIELSKPVKDETGDVSNGLPLNMGYDNWTGAFLNGMIDEVKITRRALTEAEIRSKIRIVKKQGEGAANE